MNPIYPYFITIDIWIYRTYSASSCFCFKFLRHQKLLVFLNLVRAMVRLLSFVKESMLILHGQGSCPISDWKPHQVIKKPCCSKVWTCQFLVGCQGQPWIAAKARPVWVGVSIDLGFMMGCCILLHKFSPCNGPDACMAWWKHGFTAVYRQENCRRKSYIF